METIVFLLFIAVVILFTMAGAARSRSARLQEDLDATRAKLKQAIEKLEKIEAWRTSHTAAAPPPPQALPAIVPTPQPPPQKIGYALDIAKPAAMPPPPVMPKPVAPAASAAIPPAAPPKPTPAPILPQVTDIKPAPAPTHQATPVLPPAAAKPPAPPVVPAAAIVPPKQVPPKPVAPVAAPPLEPAAATPAPASKWLDSQGGISWARIEEAVGKRWMVWGGVLAVFIAVALFAGYAFQQKWIGPGTQIIAAVTAGLILSGLGIHFLRKNMRPFGQGLLGGGIMVLYAALFCAYSPNVYAEPPLHSPLLVFGLMCVVTAAGMAAAVAFDALPIAFLAILGGVLSPVLVSRGTNERDGLFAYLMLLDVGVLGVAFYKKWRALDVLAFVGTVILFGGWFMKFYDGDPDYAKSALVGTTLWLLAFYGVFLVLPFINHLITRTELTVERFVMALTNATVAFIGAWRLLDNGNTDALAGVACLMSVAYLALGVLTTRRIPGDRKSVFGFIALSVSLLTIAIPVYFHANGITVGWTVEAAALLYLGYQFRYRHARTGAFLVLLLAVGRVYACHGSEAMGHDAPFTLIFNREFLILMCAPLGAAACAVVHQFFRGESTQADSALKRIEAVGAGLMFLAFLHVEIGQWLALNAPGWHRNPAYLQACSFSVMWALGAAAFLGSGRAMNRAWVTLLGLAPLAVAMISGVWLYTIPDAHWTLFLNARFWSAAIVAGVLFAFAFAPRDTSQRIASLVGAGYAALLLIALEVGLWASGAATLHDGWNADYVSRWPVVMVLAAGACAFFLIGARREGGAGLRLAGLLPAVVAAFFLILLYDVSLDTPQLFIVNFRFLAGLALVTAATVAGLSAKRTPETLVGCIFAGWIGILLMSLELWRWLEWMAYARTWPFAYTFTWSLTLVWAAGALGFLGFSKWKKIPAAYAAGLPALAFALIFAAAGFMTRGPDDAMLALNWRFLATIVAIGTAFAYSLSIASATRMAAGCAFSGYALLTLISVEVGGWLARVAPAHKWDYDYALGGSLTLVWALGSLAYVGVRWWKKAPSAILWGLPVLATALIIAVAGYRVAAPAHPLFAVNWRFAAAALAVVAAFASSLSAAERSRRIVTTSFSGYAALVLVSAELWYWIDFNAAAWDRPFEFTFAWSLALAWTAGAFAFLAVRWWRGVSEALGAGLAALGVALLVAALSFAATPKGAYWLAINPRFIVSGLAVAAAFAYSLTPDSRKARVFGCVFSGYAWLALLHAEFWLWIDLPSQTGAVAGAFDHLWPVTLIWAAGAGAYFAFARKLAAKEAYVAGLVPLLAGVACAIAMHVVERPADKTMLLFLNARFLPSLALAAAGFLGVALLYGDKNALGESEVAVRRLLLWATVAGLLVILSVEPYRWCLLNADPKRAPMMAQMSLSIVWALYAAAMLGAGFWKRLRGVRFAALALFAVTGLKLVIVDLSDIGPLYRIVSFFTLGVLMIASAYLYNKAEGWVKGAAQE